MSASVHMGERLKAARVRAQMSQRALAAKDVDTFLGAAETLLILMQQHNAKEEQIVYPLSDQLLASRQEEVLGQMQAAVQM